VKLQVIPKGSGNFKKTLEIYGRLRKKFMEGNRNSKRL
jgi:hypothetical protein